MEDGWSSAALQVSSVNVRASHTGEIDGKLCLPWTLDPDKVKGKNCCLRLCCDAFNVEEGETVRMVGGVGMIVCNPADEDVSPNIYSLPATNLKGDDGTTVLDHIKSMLSSVASKISIKYKASSVDLETFSLGVRTLLLQTSSSLILQL